MAGSVTAAPVAGAHNAERMDPKRVIAFFAMVFGMFMSILDIQIVSASLAEIQAGLGAGSEEVSWVQTSYLIAEVIMIPLSGALARIVSTRVMFSVSAAGFTLASALAATATSIDQMIVYRALQGFIGGGMIPSVFAAAFTIFPPSKRNVVSPIIGLVATLAPTVGPTIGGYISHAMSWHWLFLINVIPGIIVTAVTWRLIDFDKPDWSLFKKFDWWGLASMALFLGTLEYVLEEGNNKDWFSDEHIVIGTVIMLVGGLIFFYRVFKVDFPVVDLRAFANRNFAFGSLFSFIMGVGLYGLTYLYPLYLGRIRGYDSLMIGETMFVSGAAMFMTAPVAGMLSSKLDPRVMMMMGFAGFALGTYMMTGITADWDFYELLVPQILRGCSLMICMVPINNIALGTLPPDRIKNASGLFNLTRNLGGAVGLAIINTVLTQRTDEHYARLSEHVSWSNRSALDWLNSVGANYDSYGLDGSVTAIKKLSGIVTQQSWLLSFMDVFMGLTFLFAGLIVLVLMIKKPAAAAPAGSGH
ncbi:DHA2 family efflux MFS transporter permease subunit [Ciceribacter sp. L1K23]|uniref:DHA2 family efflux MFS transporter permease subunit n=1 Tax=Ciceribacter sp. L1K23 TaxID=2820276 RepID=UPI001B8372CD|nr:DHA2 family efflux MFS transporter permease subunit [Ciceribacter sp. L1K23]MBR0558079.1 DHA2 family efflux MFS transporter permease subunit [Ciceribacter sp. L1K23]